jgi:hypothetical protein
LKTFETEAVPALGLGFASVAGGASATIEGKANSQISKIIAKAIIDKTINQRTLI